MTLFLFAYLPVHVYFDKNLSQYIMILYTERKKIFIMVLFLAQMLAGCRDMTKYQDSYIIEGRMLYRDIEGGCWQFIDGNNRSYEIVGENVDQIQIDRLSVKMIVRDVENAASTCMVGKIVELIEIIQTSQPN
jgi:hypothetical protein